MLAASKVIPSLNPKAGKYHMTKSKSDLISLVLPRSHLKHHHRAIRSQPHGSSQKHCQPTRNSSRTKNLWIMMKSSRTPGSVHDIFLIRYRNPSLCSIRRTPQTILYQFCPSASRLSSSRSCTKKSWKLKPITRYIGLANQILPYLISWCAAILGKKSTRLGKDGREPPE